MDHDNVVEKSLNLVQPIPQPNYAQCTLCWQFDDQNDIYLALLGISSIQKFHFYDAETIFNHQTHHNPV